MSKSQDLRMPALYAIGNEANAHAYCTSRGYSSEVADLLIERTDEGRRAEGIDPLELETQICSFYFTRFLSECLFSGFWKASEGFDFGGDPCKRLLAACYMSMLDCLCSPFTSKQRSVHELSLEGDEGGSNSVKKKPQLFQIPQALNDSPEYQTKNAYTVRVWRELLTKGLITQEVDASGQATQERRDEYKWHLSTLDDFSVDRVRESAIPEFCRLTLSRPSLRITDDGSLAFALPEMVSVQHGITIN